MDHQEVLDLKPMEVMDLKEAVMDHLKAAVMDHHLIHTNHPIGIHQAVSDRMAEGLHPVKDQEEVMEDHQGAKGHLMEVMDLAAVMDHHHLHHLTQWGCWHKQR